MTNHSITLDQVSNPTSEAIQVVSIVGNMSDQEAEQALISGAVILITENGTIAQRALNFLDRLGVSAKNIKRESRVPSSVEPFTITVEPTALPEGTFPTRVTVRLISNEFLNAFTFNTDENGTFIADDLQQRLLEVYIPWEPPTLSFAVFVDNRQLPFEEFSYDPTRLIYGGEFANLVVGDGDGDGTVDPGSGGGGIDNDSDKTQTAVTTEIFRFMTLRAPELPAADTPQITLNIDEDSQLYKGVQSKITEHSTRRDVWGQLVNIIQAHPDVAFHDIESLSSYVVDDTVTNFESIPESKQKITINISDSQRATQLVVVFLSGRYLEKMGDLMQQVRVEASSAAQLPLNAFAGVTIIVDSPLFDRIAPADDYHMPHRISEFAAIGLADINVVEQQILRYAVGEVAHIENILPGEYRDEADDQDTEEHERIDLQAAAQAQIQKTSQSGVTMTERYGALVEGTPSLSYTSAQTSDVCRSKSVAFATDLLQRAQSHAQQQIYHERRTNPVSEVYQRGFDNTDSDQEMVIVYRFVNGVYENRLVKQEKRLVFEFLVPEPAKWLKASTPDGTSLADAAQLPAHSLRQFERSELRRRCIELILPQNFAQSQYSDDIQPIDLGTVAPLQATETNIDITALGALAPKIRFFEQAFEWDHMTYAFYPYYWTDQSAWEQLTVTNFPEETFEAFLRAGAARVLVPIQPSYERALYYYLWSGGYIATDVDVPLVTDKVWLPIVQEMVVKRSTPEIVTCWESRIPTTLVTTGGGEDLPQFEGSEVCSGNNA